MNSSINDISFDPDMDFTQYIDRNTQSSGNSTDDYIRLSDRQLKDFCLRLSGKDDKGKVRAKLAYTNYEIKEGDFSIPSDQPIIDIKDAYIDINPNKTLPDFYTIDIVFPSCDCLDLKLLWLKLEQYKKADRKIDDGKQAIFLIQVSENFEMEEIDSVKNRIFCNIINPLLFYLTREVPNQLVEEVKTEDGLQGGNIIRLLCQSPLVTFDVLGDVDTNALKEQLNYESENEADIERIRVEEYKRMKELEAEQII